MRTGKRAAIALAAVVLTAACGGETFAERDPNGYKACGDYAANQASGEPSREIGGNMVVAEQARKASTKAIRESAAENLFDDEAMAALEGTASEGNNFALLDVDAFKKACTEAGFDFE